MFGKFKKIAVIAALVVIVAAIGLAIKSNREAGRLKEQIESLKQTQQAATLGEAKQLVSEVGKLIVLPEGEDPTVATITDREKLNDVPFFARAQNGDKVLIYVNARKAYLYRTGEKKLIEVATLNLNTATQDFSAKVALRNGTETAGLTKRFEDVLIKGLPKVEVTSRGDAKKTTYAQTLVVDLTGSRKDDAQKLATTVSGRVAALPADESKPEGADFLVIIGTDKSVSPSPSPSKAASPSPSPN